MSDFVATWAMARREVSKDVAKEFSQWVNKKDPLSVVPLAELFDEWADTIWKGLLSE